MSDEGEVLQGGVGNAGAVIRVGDHVLRPRSPHWLAIHALLRHVRSAGFDGVPEVIGLDTHDRERLTFIPGDVPLIPFPAWSQTEDALASTASLLRRFHDATAGFVAPEGATWSDELADRGADEVICHNDVCPENVVFRDGVAVALLDFEYAAPGRRAFDVASMARMCVPIEMPADAERTGRRGLDPVSRLGVVADAYGLDRDQRTELLHALATQIDSAGEFVRRRVERGDPAFIEMWHATGGQARYDRRRDWFATERPRFLHRLLNS